MSIQLTVPPKRELKPRIVVFGVGGAGGNAVNNMVAAGLEGVDFVVANTDAQALTNSKADRRIQIGSKITEGLGAGSNPEVGKAAAEETMAEIVDMLQGSHMAFVTAGMGGGTGTGAAPVIARAAREQGILTVGVVTTPFDFEGGRRMRSAKAGIEELAREVDTLIIIPNQNLFRIANAQTTFAEAFAMADEVLHSGVAGITDLMIKPGLINLDFADVRTVMNEMGKAMMGTGEAEGDKRAVEAAEAAIANPLLDDVSMQGARGVLINITGGNDMTLYELDEAASRIKQEVDPEANIIIGSTFDEALNGMMRVSVVATGIDAEAAKLTAMDGGRIIQMTPNGDAPVTDAPAEPAAPGLAPLAAEAPATPGVTPGVMPEAMPAPASADSDLPSFLAGGRAEQPAHQPISKRKRSFIDRVFGAKKDTTSAQTMPSPRIAIDELPQAPISDAPSAPLEITEAPMPVGMPEPSPMAQPAAFQNELDGAPEVPATAAEIKAPEPVMETKAEAVAQAPTLDLASQDSAASASAEVETPVEAPVETPVETKAEAPKVSAPVVSAPVVSAPVVSAPSVDAVSSEPIVQTSMQTGPTMSAGSSFDADQLDIPAFLRR